MKTAGWQVTAYLDGPTHVTPIDDLRAHLQAPCCWCGPKRDEGSDTTVWVHNSLDRREQYERGEMRVS